MSDAVPHMRGEILPYVARQVRDKNRKCKVVAISVRFGGDIAEVSNRIESSWGKFQQISTSDCAKITLKSPLPYYRKFTLHEINANNRVNFCFHLRLLLSSSSTKRLEKSHQKIHTVHCKLLSMTFLVVNNKNLTMTKHLVCESSYRPQIENGEK